MPTLTEQRTQVFDAFRRLGYFEADLDPLGLLQHPVIPELEVTGEAAQSASGFYCGTIGVEFAHILDPQRRRHQSFGSHVSRMQH